MKPELRKILNPAVLNLNLYSADTSDCRIKLNQNENSFPLPSFLKERILELWRSADWNRYPEIDSKTLRQRLARSTGVDSSMVAVGNGSNELLAALLTLISRPEKQAVLCAPSFSLYSHFVEMNGLAVRNIRLNENYSFPLMDICKAASHPDTSITIICSPNNPTGTGLTYEELESVLQTARGLVICDEAYSEF